MSGLPELERLLAWADAEGVEVGVVGSGSNLLVADVGVRGLVLKLDKELSTIELDGTRIRCGGGGRRRLQARFGLALEPEVQVLGPVLLPPEWGER